MELADIKEELLVQRELPMGLQAFHEWADRIIAGAMIPHDQAQTEVFIESQKYALANMLMHLKPTECFESDLYFIKSLRKYAVNEVADYYRRQIYAKRKAITDAAEEKKLQEDLAEED